MAKLPNIRLPEETRTALEAFADENGMRLSDAIRRLIEESPRWREYANRKGLKADFNVNWGGRRIPKDVQEELDQLRKKP